jgi:hypothetical protein
MTVSQRFAQIDALNAMADAFATADLRRTRPSATTAQLQEMLRDRRRCRHR